MTLGLGSWGILKEEAGKYHDTVNISALADRITPTQPPIYSNVNIIYSNLIKA